MHVPQRMAAGRLAAHLYNDGDAIRLNGKVYAKGLGAAPFSDSDSVITYY